MPGEDQGAIPVLAPGCDTTADKADGQSRSEKPVSHLPMVLGAGTKSSATPIPAEPENGHNLLGPFQLE